MTIVWSMVSATCFSLGGVYAVIWSKQSRQPVHLLFALMAVAAGLNGLSELWLLHTESIATYHRILRWQHIPLFLLLVPMVWAVDLHFDTGRRWLVWVITVLWVISLIVNFVSPHNLVYTEITALHRVETFGGQFFTVVKGFKNPWAYLGDFASLLILIFVADASVRLWRKGGRWRNGGRRRAVIIGGSIVVFILLAGLHTPLVDSGWVRTPYMISFAFLAIVVAMSYQLGSDSVRASQLSLEVENNERRWRSLLERVELLVVGADRDGRVDFVNSCFERVTGFSATEVLGKSVVDLVVTEEQDEMVARFQKALVQGPLSKSTWSFRCKNGDSRQIVFSSVRLEDPNGVYTGLLSVGEDITDRIRAEATARDLTERLINAQEEERSRVARDLHDDITQRIARLSIDAAQMERGLSETRLEAMKSMRADLVRLGEDVHSIAYRLHSSMLEDLGLPVALASECERLSTLEHVPIDIKEIDLPERLPQNVALGLFRVAQEALRNISRHARAKSATVTLRGMEGGVQLAVHDDGVGFDPTNNRKKPSMGLAGMRERLSYLGGELDVESSPGHGTTIVAWAPLETKADPSGMSDSGSVP